MRFGLSELALAIEDVANLVMRLRWFVELTSLKF
jgi:hypothetical protein